MEESLNMSNIPKQYESLTIDNPQPSRSYFDEPKYSLPKKGKKNKRLPSLNLRAPAQNQIKGDFVLDGQKCGVKILEYNGLKDKNCQGYFYNKKVRKLLKIQGLITKDGIIVEKKADRPLPTYANKLNAEYSSEDKSQYKNSSINEPTYYKLPKIDDNQTKLLNKMKLTTGHKAPGRDYPESFLPYTNLEMDKHRLISFYLPGSAGRNNSMERTSSRLDHSNPDKSTSKLDVMDKTSRSSSKSPPVNLYRTVREVKSISPQKNSKLRPLTGEELKEVFKKYRAKILIVEEKPELQTLLSKDTLYPDQLKTIQAGSSSKTTFSVQQDSMDYVKKGVRDDLRRENGEENGPENSTRVRTSKADHELGVNHSSAPKEDRVPVRSHN